MQKGSRVPATVAANGRGGPEVQRLWLRPTKLHFPCKIDYGGNLNMVIVETNKRWLGNDQLGTPLKIRKVEQVKGKYGPEIELTLADEYDMEFRTGCFGENVYMKLTTLRYVNVLPTWNYVSMISKRSRKMSGTWLGKYKRDANR